MKSNLYIPSYVSLLENESVLVVVRPVHINYLCSYILVGVLFLGGLLGLFLGIFDFEFICIVPASIICLVGGLVCVSHAFFSVLLSEYTITNGRIISRTGIVERKISEIWIDDIRGVKYNSNLLQILVGTCNIGIGTAATEGTEIRIMGVKKGRSIMKLINSIREEN